MESSIVRIVGIKINNLKNVKNGHITLNNFLQIKYNFELQKGDVVGLYGQNGSGKTALVESFNILKHMLAGEEIPANIKNLICVDERSCNMVFDFYVKDQEEKYLLSYEFEIRKEDNKHGIMVSKERLSCSKLEEGKWQKRSKLIEYDNNAKKPFSPISCYREVTSVNKEAHLKLNVSKEMSRKSATSFVFAEESRNVFRESLGNHHQLVRMIANLRYFAVYNLYVIMNSQLGEIKMNQLQLFTFKSEKENKKISKNLTVKLFGTDVVSKSQYEFLLQVIDQINVVLCTIIPGLHLESFQLGKSFLGEEEIGIQFEILSVRDNIRISLKNESDGIKKIISILSTMIAMYNRPSSCLVIDELDSGIFEYLLGEVLEVLDNGSKGQLIFTSHNLRALEKLDKDSIFFTTANPNNRYIHLDKTKSIKNLRDFYLRGISLGGQKEIIYEETNIFEMQHAIRKAGQVIESE